MQCFRHSRRLHRRFYVLHATEYSNEMMTWDRTLRAKTKPYTADPLWEASPTPDTKTPRLVAADTQAGVTNPFPHDTLCKAGRCLPRPPLGRCHAALIPSLTRTQRARVNLVPAIRASRFQVPTGTRQAIDHTSWQMYVWFTATLGPKSNPNSPSAAAALTNNPPPKT